MKSHIVAALGAIALLGAGCSGCSTITGNQAVLGSTVVDEKALYAAEAAFYGANTAADVAVKAGLLIPSSATAIKVADYLKDGKAALDAARNAYALGDAKTLSDKITAADVMIAQAWSLIPQKKAA